MNRTREDFCHSLLDDDSPQYTLDPERLAARFVRYFRVSGRPTMPELTGLLEEAGFGTVEGRRLDSMKGVHVSAPGGSYNIYYRQNLWDGAAEHTLLHEAYEIIHETLCDMESGSPPERKVCREADRFAAAALMQPQAFSLVAEGSGLDVLALQRTYRCSYASVTLRLAEVMENHPLMTVLYEREEKRDPADWAEPPALWATVVRRTRGFGNPAAFPISGERRCAPRRGRPPSPPAPWRSGPSATATRSTPTRTATPSSPRPSSGRGGWRRSSSPCPTGTRPFSAPSWSPPTSRRAGGVRWRLVPGS